MDDREELNNQIYTWLRTNKSPNKRDDYSKFLCSLVFISLKQLAKQNLDDVFGENVLRHSFNLFRVPFFVVLNPVTSIDDSLFEESRDEVSFASGETSSDFIYEDIRPIKAVRAAAYATIMIRSIFTENTIHEQCSDEELQRLAKQTTLITKRTYDSSIQETSHLFGYFCNKDKNLKSVIVNLLEVDFSFLNNLGLRYMKADLDYLKKYLLENEQLESNRISKYAQKFDATSFVSPTLLEEILLRDTLSKKQDIAFSRVLIVGHGGSGKTTLFDMLSGNETSANSTIVTNINLIKDCELLWLQKNNLQKATTIELWDFAGQSQYYGLHQTFFNERCVFILVVDSRHQQSPYEWLYQIQTLTNNTKVTVFLIVNEYEQCPPQINKPEIQRRFENLNICFYAMRLIGTSPSCEKSIYKFKQELIQQAVSEERIVNKKIANVQKHIIDKFNNDNINSISNDCLQRIIDDTQIKTDRLVELFGSLIQVTYNYGTHWLRSDWVNNIGYQLLFELQKTKMISHSNTDILKQCKEIGGSDNQEDYVKLLNLLTDTKIGIAIQLKNQQMIFPSTLPVDDPNFISTLEDISKYNAYGVLNISIDFMQMGLFSQMVAKWLNLNNDEVTLNDGNFSRYTCILSAKNDIHLVIHWHSYLKRLSFKFYQPVNITEPIIDEYKKLLHVALNTLSNFEHLMLRTDTSTVGQKIIVDSDLLESIIADLDEISQKGFFKTYSFQSLTKEGLIVNNTNNFNSSTISNSNISAGGENNTQVTQHTITNEDEALLIEALNALHQMYKENNKDASKQENFTKIISGAKKEIEEGKLSEPKKDFFIQLKDAFNAGTIGLKFTQKAAELFASFLV